MERYRRVALAGARIARLLNCHHWSEKTTSMNYLVRCLALGCVVNLLLASGALYGQATPRPAELPDAPGRETVKKVCAACHPAEVVLGKGMTREQWGGIVSNMISRGAKGTEAEFADVVDYLSKNLPPKQNSAPPGAARQRAAGGGLLAQAGASDKHIVDDQAAARGQVTYTARLPTRPSASPVTGRKGGELPRVPTSSALSSSFMIVTAARSDPFCSKVTPRRVASPAQLSPKLKSRTSPISSIGKSAIRCAPAPITKS